MVEQKQQRRYFLGANWKCNGTTAFLKDIVNNLINDVEYDKNKLGRCNFNSVALLCVS